MSGEKFYIDCETLSNGEKILPWTTTVCRHPGHDFPSHMVVPDRGYTHVCPCCGFTITVPGPQIWM